MSNRDEQILDKILDQDHKACLQQSGDQWKLNALVFGEADLFADELPTEKIQ